MNSEKILENMIAFIKQHGKEEAANIRNRTQEDYTKAAQGAYNEKKKIITKKYKDMLEDEKKNFKIEKSKA